jgi:hypothetical protein
MAPRSPPEQATRIMLRRLAWLQPGGEVQADAGGLAQIRRTRYCPQRWL